MRSCWFGGGLQGAASFSFTPQCTTIRVLKNCDPPFVSTSSCLESNKCSAAMKEDNFMQIHLGVALIARILDKALKTRLTT